VYDRYFYQTNALYTELFRRGHRLSTMDAAPLPFAGVYWVPRRWRPHAWAGLLQLDRALPLGRYVLVGHALAWASGLWAASPTYLAAFVAVLVVGKNAAVFALGAPAAAPPAFQLHLQHPADWVVTRGFVNLRWTLLLLLSLLGLAAFTGALPYTDAFLWTGADVFAAFFFAWLVTHGTELTYRRRFA
jgi:hypothetical protein